MIIFDLDETLADCEHRRHFVQEPPIWNRNENEFDPMSFNINCEKWVNWKPDWKSFYEACDKDEPTHQTLNIFKLLSEDNEVQIWSGRCESVRHKTELWLWDHAGCGFDSSLTYPQILKMRPIGDSTPDDVLKERWLDEAIAEGKKIDFVFDDRPKVVRMWRRRGIFVFNCCQHDEEF